MSDFLILIGTACLVCIFQLGQAQDLSPFNDWDSDSDGIISDEEFGDGLASVDYYDDWDLNDDGILDDDEFGNGLFNTWDANDDGILDSDEWNYGLSDEFGADYADFDTWDTDGNGEIIDDEFDEVYADSNIYDDWDIDNDGGIVEDEVEAGIFSWLDGDNDRYLDADEVGVADDMFSDYM